MTKERRGVRVRSQMLRNGSLLDMQRDTEDLSDDPVILAGFNHVGTSGAENLAVDLFVFRQAENQPCPIGSENWLLQRNAAPDELQGFAIPQFLDQLRITPMQRQTTELRAGTVNVARTQDGPFHFAGICIQEFEFAEPFLPAVPLLRVMRGFLRLRKFAMGRIEDEISRDEHELFRATME